MYPKTRYEKFKSKIAITNVGTLLRLTIKVSKYFFVVLPYEEIEHHKLGIKKIKYWLVNLALLIINIIVLGSSFLRVLPKELLENPYVILGFSRLIFSQIAVLFSTIFINKKYKKTIKCLNELMEWDKLLPLPDNLLKKQIMAALLEFAAIVVGFTYYNIIGLFANGDFSIWTLMQALPGFISRTYYEASQMHFLLYTVWFDSYIESIHMKLEEVTVVKDPDCIGMIAGIQSNMR